jgi:hypothetical protein
VSSPRRGVPDIGCFTTKEIDMNSSCPVAFSKAIALVALTLSAGAAEAEKAPAKKAAVSEPGATDAGQLEGVWSGSWGLMIEPNGIVHRPVHAELFIQGNRVEWKGFPGVSQLAGTIRIDAGAKQIRVTPAAKAGGQPADAIVYSYEIKGDDLTLTGSDKRGIPFSRVRFAPLLDVKTKFQAAVGVNEAGDLLVTEFVAPQARRSGTITPDGPSPLKLKQAVVFLTRDRGVKTASLDDVRRLIREPTPVVVVFRPDDHPSPLTTYQRWQEADSEAVGRTLSRFMRPGTLVFVLPESANVTAPP